MNACATLSIWSGERMCTLFLDGIYAHCVGAKGYEH